MGASEGGVCQRRRPSGGESYGAMIMPSLRLAGLLMLLLWIGTTLPQTRGRANVKYTLSSPGELALHWEDFPPGRYSLELEVDLAHLQPEVASATQGLTRPLNANWDVRMVVSNSMRVYLSLTNFLIGSPGSESRTTRSFMFGCWTVGKSEPLEIGIASREACPLGTNAAIVLAPVGVQPPVTHDLARPLILLLAIALLVGEGIRILRGSGRRVDPSSVVASQRHQAVTDAHPQTFQRPSV